MIDIIELIKHAAVKSEDGNIFIGKCHADCFEKAHYIKIKMSKKPEDQGFMTNLGRYVKRSEAAEIALKSNQIDKVTRMLFSEDLWCTTYDEKHTYSETKGYLLKE